MGKGLLRRCGLARDILRDRARWNVKVHCLRGTKVHNPGTSKTTILSNKTGVYSLDTTDIEFFNILTIITIFEKRN